MALSLSASRLRQDADAIAEKLFRGAEGGATLAQCQRAARHFVASEHASEPPAIGSKDAPTVNVRVLAHDIARQRGIPLGKAQEIALDMAAKQKAKRAA